MIWKKIINDHSSLQEYRLTDNNNATLILKYNPLHGSARVTFGLQHRLFYLENVGSYTSKVRFKNEYEMETGNMIYDRLSTNKGVVVIDEMKTSFELTKTNLKIFPQNNNDDLIICSIQPAGATAFDNFPGDSVDHTCYLLGLAWYLLVASGQKAVLEYATAS